MLLLYLFFRKILKPAWKTKSGSFIKFFMSSFLGCILIISFARGSLRDIPLSTKFIEISSNDFVNEVPLNGVVALSRAWKIRQKNESPIPFYKRLGFKNINEAFSIYLGFDTSGIKKDKLIELLVRKTKENAVVEDIKPHVVVIAMESLGSFWGDFHSEHFPILGSFKKHIEDDYFFSNFLSADNGTIGSLVALMTSLPYRSKTRYLSEGQFMNTPLSSASHLPYKSKGYETSFVYSGKLAWRNIGKYAKLQDYHHVLGSSHIKEQQNLKSEKNVETEWGVHDEYLFNYIKEKIENANRPQMFLALTTTNHPPYEYPQHFKSELKIPEELNHRIVRDHHLIEDRIAAYHYSVEMLGRFISQIKNSSLKDKVIIAVTGDHNFFGFIDYKASEVFKRYSVPFYLYVPEKLKPTNYDPKKLGSHEDIFPTLYNLSLSNTPYLTVGEDLFGGNESMAINSALVVRGDNMIYKDKIYQNKSVVDGKKDEWDLYKAIIAITDFYLRESLR
jgi:phosphoglycerol transferase MdoB-like AlkP superfamily enzyme